MSNNKELNKVEKTEDERIENFKEFVAEVEKTVDEEIKKSSLHDEDLTKSARVRNGILNRIWWTITNGLLGLFKVKITLYYRDKIIFEYVIPKD